MPLITIDNCGWCRLLPLTYSVTSINIYVVSFDRSLYTKPNCFQHANLLESSVDTLAHERLLEGVLVEFLSATHQIRTQQRLPGTDTNQQSDKTHSNKYFRCWLSILSFKIFVHSSCVTPFQCNKAYKSSISYASF